jgi:hypothetical protein
MQIFKQLPDFHEIHHERYATQGESKAIIFNLSGSVIKTRWTWEIVRWEDTTVAINFEHHTTAHLHPNLSSSSCISGWGMTAYLHLKRKYWIWYDVKVCHDTEANL